MNDISDFAFVGPCVIMGDNNVVMEGAIIRDGVIMGDNNYVGPYCIIGDLPEKRGWFDKGKGVDIGDDNRFTKQVTIDAGTVNKTKIHNRVLMLKNAHVGHDAQISDNVVLSCNSAIGGWTDVGADCNFGLGAVAHQRLVIPENCMIGMNSTITKKSFLNAHHKYAGSPVREIGLNPSICAE
jgi:UDP-N-acetylglucosamine acyltransferase